MAKVDAKTIYKINGKVTTKAKYSIVVAKAQEEGRFSNDQIKFTKKTGLDEKGRVIKLRKTYNFRTNLDRNTPESI